MGDAEQLLLGTFRLERPVARGGMGQIWLATDVETGERAAIKRMRLEEEGKLDEEMRARLLREIDAFQRVEHENIVRCLGWGLDSDDQPYLALEWLEGEDLAARQSRAPLSLDEVVELARQALRGLGACHARGVIHRDVKPGNLFLVPSGEGFRVKVLDLGLAIHDEASRRLTRAGAVLGTLYYLSPEQARGQQDLDGRTDLYSLAVVLYQLVTGRLPFQGEAAFAVLLKIVTEQPPRPRQLRPDLPPWLDQLILRAMERDRDARHADAAAMLAALEQGASQPLESWTTAGPLEAVPSSSIEYRLVALLCVAPLDPGDAELANAVESTIEQAEGKVQRLLGGQVVGLFGLDRSDGDEARRAVSAGLAIRGVCGERARLLAATVHLEVGEGLRLDAKELDRAASGVVRQPPGELVADRPTREQLGGQLEVERVRGLEVVRAMRGPRRRRVLGVDTPIVGRETELAAVQAAFERAGEHGEPEVVLVQGPAGMGKTRLCQEALQQIAERASLELHGRAGPLQTATPYSLIAQCLTRPAGIHVGQALDEAQQALRSFTAGLAPDLDETALSFLGEAIGVPFPETAALQVARQDPKVMRERITEAFAALIGAVGERGPLIVHLDDVHWADEESLQLVAQLADRLDRTPLFVLLAARPELEPRRLELLRAAEATRLELEPLGRRPLRRLLHALLSREIPRELEELIGSWSDGNPFFAEELVAWLVNCRALVQGEQGWQLEVSPATLQLPAGIEAAVQARLDLLEPLPKELLKAASVLGEVFWEGACEAMGFDEVESRLRQLETELFVVSRRTSRIAGTREWMFRHALVCQVAAQMVPRERRRVLHLQVARWLESVGETDAAALAHHFAEGGDEGRAAHYRARAGERSLADGDLEQAVEHFLASIAVEAEDAEQTRRTMGLARAQILLGRYDQARMVMERSRAADEAQGGELMLLRGRVQLATGQYGAAEQTLEAARSGLAIHAVAGRAFEAARYLFAAIWAQGRYADAGAIAEAMYAEAGQTGHGDQLCSAKLSLAYYHAVSGDLSASVRLACEAVEHAREVGHPYREVDCLTLLASAQELVGLYDAATQSLDAASALARRLKTTYHQATVEACQGRICLLRGELPRALEHYRAAARLAESIGDYRTLIAVLAGEARVLVLPGSLRDLERAEEAATRALEMATSHAPPSEAEARLALVEVSLAADRPARALEHARGAVRLLDDLGTQERYEIEILLAAHTALSRGGERQEADGVLERACAAVEARRRAIADPTLARSFVEKVPHNRRARELAQSEGQIPS